MTRHPSSPRGDGVALYASTVHLAPIAWLSVDASVHRVIAVKRTHAPSPSSWPRLAVLRTRSSHPQRRTTGGQQQPTRTTLDLVCGTTAAAE